MFQGHLTDEGWQEESSRVLEQRPKMHGHHTSSGVCLEHGDSVPMCANLDGVCVLQWGMIYSQVTGCARPWRSVGEPWIVSFSWLVANGVPSIWVWYDQTVSSSLAIVRQHFGQPAVDEDEDGRPARRLLQKSSREVMREWIRVSAAAWVRKGLIAATCGAESMLSDRYENCVCPYSLIYQSRRQGLLYRKPIVNMNGSRYWIWMNSYWNVRKSVRWKGSSFCDFEIGLVVIWRRLSHFWHFRFLCFLAWVMRRTVANINPKGIHFDSVDFSGHHSKKLCFFWRSVYIYIWRVLSQNALSAIFEIFKVRAPSYNTK